MAGQTSAIQGKTTPRIRASTLTDARIRKRIMRLSYAVLALCLAIPFSFPLYFMLASSFKAETEVLATPFRWLPENFQGFLQYQRAFDFRPVGRYFFNSTLVATINVVVTVFFSALAGYGFAKFKFRFRRFLFMAVLGTLMVPFQILVIPLYMQMNAFGWLDSYPGLILPGIMNALGVFMMRQFCYSIPDELLDAARIDGASEPRIFIRIVLPLLGPASASLAIVIFLLSWNNFLWPLVITQSPDLYTLPVGLTAYSLPYHNQPMWAAAMAVSTVAVLPVALIFIFFQRYFIEGMLLSGIKG